MALFSVVLVSVTCLILLLPLASTSESEVSGGCSCPLSKSKATQLIENIKANVRLLEDHLLNVDDDDTNKIRFKRSTETEPTASTQMEDSQTNSDPDSLDWVSTLIQTAEDKILNKTAEIVKREIGKGLSSQMSFANTAYADVIVRLVSLQKNQWTGFNLIQKLMGENVNLLKGNFSSKIMSIINEGVANISNLIQEQASTADSTHLEALRTQTHSILKQIRDNSGGNEVSLNSIQDGLEELIKIETIRAWESKHYDVTNQVNSTEELQEALRNGVRGSVIELSEGTYIGQFVLSKDNMVLVGKGDRTILKQDVGDSLNSYTIGLRILGNNSKVRNLKLLTSSTYTYGIQTGGSGTEISQVKLEGFHTALYVLSGSEDNTFSKVQIKNGKWGFYVKSNRNSLANIQLENMTDHGVHFLGSNNKVYSLTCDNCRRGFWVYGNDNLIKRAEVRKCGDYRCLYLLSNSSNVVIRNSVFESVWVDGTDHHLVNVDAGTELIVHGSGHRIDKYKAKKVVNKGTNVEFIQPRV